MMRELEKIGTTNGSECTLIAKKTGSAKITAECGGISADIRIHVQKNQENLSALDIALTIHGINYSSEQVTACFADQYYTFIEEYGDSAAYYGLDASVGIKCLAEQYCDYSEDGTWYGYFLEAAVENLRQTQALCDYALVTAMRHILIMAEADKTGECTDEAISAAHEKAKQLYEEWSGLKT